jgi:hypothetical protein
MTDAESAMWMESETPPIAPKLTETETDDAEESPDAAELDEVELPQTPQVNGEAPVEAEQILNWGPVAVAMVAAEKLEPDAADLMDQTAVPKRRSLILGVIAAVVVLGALTWGAVVLLLK